MTVAIIVVLLFSAGLLIRMLTLEDEIQRLRQQVMLTEDVYRSACTANDLTYWQYNRMYQQYTLMYDIYKSEHPDRFEEETNDKPE